MENTQYQLAVRYYSEGQYEKARILAKNLMYQEPFEAAPYKLMGMSQQALGQYAYAIGAYQRALMLQANDSQTLYFMAQCYCALSQYERAQKALQASLAFNSDHIGSKELFELIDNKLH